MIRKGSATKQISTIIFDLSEVFIAGLIGVEEHLTDRLQMPAVEVLSAFRGELLDELCCGVISEDAYLSHLLQRHGWAITEGELKALIRRNFHRKVPGMDAVLSLLLGHYHLVLLSDNAFEWVSYVEQVHPFLRAFDARFFSYQIGQIKRDSSTFIKVLSAIGRSAEECVFVDDNPANVSAATSAGLQATVFFDSGQLLKYFRTLRLIQHEDADGGNPSTTR